jgi:hypothetical protein
MIENPCVISDNELQTIRGGPVGTMHTAVSKAAWLKDDRHLRLSLRLCLTVHGKPHGH